MPFTVAHTVAVLPFVKSRDLCASALVAGSMAPDFEYFIKMNVEAEWGHNLAGIVLFDLPMTFVMVLLFHTVIKYRLIDNLPTFLQKRFGHLRQVTVKQDIFDRPFMFALCACAGAATHVFWDGFTHGTGYFVKSFRGFYGGTIVHYDGVDYPMWYALQHFSTLIGMSILVVYILLKKPSYSNVTRPKLLYWMVVSSIAALAAIIRLQFPHPTKLPMTVIALISGFCIGLIVLGLLPYKTDRVDTNPRNG